MVEVINGSSTASLSSNGGNGPLKVGTRFAPAPCRRRTPSVGPTPDVVCDTSFRRRSDGDESSESCRHYLHKGGSRSDCCGGPSCATPPSWRPLSSGH